MSEVGGGGMPFFKDRMMPCTVVVAEFELAHTPQQAMLTRCQERTTLVPTGEQSIGWLIDDQIGRGMMLEMSFDLLTGTRVKDVISVHERNTVVAVLTGHTQYFVFAA